MNTPSSALVWELWRKNRLGFVVLFTVFAMCAALAAFTSWLEQKQAALESHNPNVVTLAAEGILRSSPTGLVAERIVLKLNAKTIFDNILGPEDRFEITGLFEDLPKLRIVLAKPYIWVQPRSSEVSSTGSPETPQGSNATATQPGPPQPTVYEGRLPNHPALSWSAADGRNGEVALAFNPSYNEELMLAGARADRWRSISLAWSLGMLTFSLFALFAIFGAAEPNSARGFTGIPPRRFTLPVRTSTLVGWPMGLGWATLALTYLAWSYGVLQPLTKARGSMPDLYLLLLLSAGLSSFQALVWALPSFPKLRAFLLTLLVLSLFIGAALPFDSTTNRLGEPVLMAACGVLWAATIGAAWLGVKLERRGFWNGWARLDPAADSFRLVLPTVIQFAGPLHAQCWMEWRRNGRMAVGVTVAIFIALAACAATLPFGDGHLQTVAGALVSVLSFAAAGWVGIAGLNLARDGSSRTLAMSSFTAVRPVSVGTMIEAKLIVGIIVWLAGAFGFAAVWAVLSMLSPGRSAAPALFLCWTVAVSAHVFVGILPLCLSGRMAGFPWSFLPWLLVYGGIVNVAIWFGEHPNHLDALFWLCAFALLLKLAMAGWGFTRAVRERLVSPGFVGVYVTLWLLLSSFLVRAALAQVDGFGWGDWSMALIPGAALMIPLARIALSPLALAANRHR